MTSAPADFSSPSDPLADPGADAWLGEGRAGRRHYQKHLLAAAIPLAAGAVLYGWRAALLILLLLGSAAVAMLIWRGLGRGGGSIRLPCGLWMALLLALMLPPHLLTARHREPLAPVSHLWALIPAAALLLAMLFWVVRTTAVRFHPAALTYLTLALLFGAALEPRVVLHRSRVVTGDVNSLPESARTQSQPSHEEGWIYLQTPAPADSLYSRQTAADRLSGYTRGRQPGRPVWLSLDGLLRDAMPPLEDLVVGGHPGPIGASSAIAVLIGGLLLIYLGLIDHRIPLLVICSTAMALLVLPVPVVVTSQGAQWSSILLHRAHLDWATIITFANYEMLASPLLFSSFFLAASPLLCPARRSARTFYAVSLGILTAACQIYVSCPLGPYIALLISDLLAAWLDRDP